jgi:hypothetical protein
MIQAVRSRETRSLGKYHQRSAGRTSPGWNEIFESPTWLDSRPFKEYAKDRSNSAQFRSAALHARDPRAARR